MLNDNGKLKSEIEGIKVESEIKEEEVNLTESFSRKMVKMEEQKKLVEQFAVEGMEKGVDYDYFNNSKKPSLLKCGAEKLVELFNLSVKVEIMSKEENWEGLLFSYDVKVLLADRETGGILGEGVGSCNSTEVNFQDNLISSLSNTIIKMAKKRALVDAVLTTLCISELFTQDIEELDKSCKSKDGPAKKEQLKKIYDLAAELNLNRDKAKKIMFNSYGVNDSRELSESQASDFISKLEKNKKQN